MPWKFKNSLLLHINNLSYHWEEMSPKSNSTQLLGGAFSMFRESSEQGFLSFSLSMKGWDTTTWPILAAVSLVEMGTSRYFIKPHQSWTIVNRGSMGKRGLGVTKVFPCSEEKVVVSYSDSWRKHAQKMWFGFSRTWNKDENTCIFNCLGLLEKNNIFLCSHDKIIEE